MTRHARWSVDASRILTREEIATVLADLHRRAARSRYATNARTNLAIFRLACCCGLRRAEIAGLELRDLRLAIARPHINIRAAIAKGCRGRRVPLWWDAGTLADLTAHRARRMAEGADSGAPVVVSSRTGCEGRPLRPKDVRRRFRTGCKALGAERLASLTVHDGRHSFISHALAAGRTLAEVQQAAGHASIATTSIYVHIAVDDDGAIGEIWSTTPS